MKYAKEVIELMGAHPGRGFRSKEIINYVMKAMRLASESRTRVRKGVGRVLEQMIESGAVHVVEASARGEFALYCFGQKCDIEALKNNPGLETIGRPKLRPQKQIDPFKAYVTQRNGARQRGIEWRFTFETWWLVWKNHFHLRGPGKDDLCMARDGDEGPYSPENVYLTTNSRNSIDRNTSQKAFRRKMETIERRGRRFAGNFGSNPAALSARRQDAMRSASESEVI